MKIYLLTIITVLIVTYSSIGQSSLDQPEILKEITPPITEVPDKPAFDNQFKWKGDTRFRIEQDWSSRKSDGSYRNDRTRARYRFRVGFVKNINKNTEVGFRVRTGSLTNQQDPHVTIGKAPGEFSTIGLGIEKLYVKYQYDNFFAWIGKNEFPFWKQHEILWNDNVFPEGITLGYKYAVNKNMYITPIASHFIFKSSGLSLDQDSYISSLQLESKIDINPYNDLKFNIGNIYFNQMPNIPDVEDPANFDYNLITSSFAYTYKNWQRPVSIGFDAYYNTVDYTNTEAIPQSLKEEKLGLVFNVKIGELKKKNDLLFHFYYANIGKYALVDYLAQNDWGRWDYSSHNASAGRLTNYSGMEFKVGYAISDKISINARYYTLTEKVKMGKEKENGQRARLDLNVKF